MLSRLVITFLPRRREISWLKSPSAVILEPKKMESATVPTVSPSIYHEMMRPDAMILVFWIWAFISVQSLRRVQLFVTPWTTAFQASLSITNSRSSPKPMSIESVIPSNHLILCHPLLLLPSIFSSIRVFSNESGGQSTEAWALASVLPMNIQDWFPLGPTVLISLQSKGLSRVFSNTTFQKHQFFGAQLLYSPTLTSIHDHCNHLCWQSDGPTF